MVGFVIFIIVVPVIISTMRHRHARVRPQYKMVVVHRYSKTYTVRRKVN